MARTKKTKVKSTTVDYIVDLTNAQSAQDAYLAFAVAKLNAYLTQAELDAFLDEVTPKIYICFDNTPKKAEKKPNIFKRVWNWITGK